MPFLSELFIRTISQGKSSLFITFTIIPTFKSFQKIFLNCLLFKSETKHYQLFSIESDLCLLISSIISLTPDKANTKINGIRIAGLPLEILIGFITCNIKITRKYIFAIFLNYLKRFLGRKLYQVY